MMGRTTSGKGFTLVELLIVIAIIGILAAVAVPNFKAFLATAVVTTERAQYIVYVVEEGKQREVATIDLGEVQITLPKRMAVGDSGSALLCLVPSQQIGDKLNVTYGPTEVPSFYYAVSDVISLYPVMAAELKAPNFAIDSETVHTYYRAVSLDSSTVWEWIISPKVAGEQLLAFELYAPVQVKGFEGLPAKAVYSRSFIMSVKEPFSWAPVWAAIGGVSALLGILGWFLKLRRRHKIYKSDVKNVPGPGPSGQPNAS